MPRGAGGALSSAPMSAPLSVPLYAAFFGLHQAPFSIAPDPRYLFMSERHREALAHLLYGLDAGGGVALLTGAVGAGKTTVCRCFLEQIPAHCRVAYIFNPQLSAGELLRAVCDEFGVAHPPAAPGPETLKDCIDPLNAFLLAAHAAGRNSVLIVDEAQNLTSELLEQLRLLTNLETSERKLLQIILIGQPELRAQLAQAALEPLAQRVVARFHLDALDALETQRYIAHRLAVAGWSGPPPFDRRALRRVHALSRGVPRRINLLCDRALLGAYAAGLRAVGAAMVERAAREVFDAPAAAARTRRRPWARWPAWGLGVAALLAVAAWGWWPVPPLSLSLSGQARAIAPLAAPAGAALASAADLQGFLLAQSASAAPHWRALALAWGVELPAGAQDACAALARSGLRCHRQRQAGLHLLRQIDRPLLLTLFPARDDAAAAPVTVLLRQLDGATATLEGAGRSLRVPLSALAPLWRGEFSTLWRAPPAMPGQSLPDDSAAGAQWLDQQLASLAAAGAGGEQRTAPTTTPITAAQRQSRVQDFQFAQGLTPDGQAGPLTLMLLNRAIGVDEPRLLRSGA